MKAQFTLYVDDNTDLTFELEGENLRDLLNQVDKNEKICMDWTQEELDRHPPTRRQKISGKLFPILVFVEGLAVGAVLSPYAYRFLFGVHP